MAFNLTYLERFKIKNEAEGLLEPSGLVLDRDGSGLWVVCDNARRMFRITPNGQLSILGSFDIPDDGLEGVTIDPDARHLYTVREETNELIKFDIAQRKEAGRRPISEMTGYAEIAEYFEGGEENKGLEGIAWNTDTSTLFVLKEGNPGLLIEIGLGFGEILSHSVLIDESGFTDPGSDPNSVDYSGICYDPTRQAFWIVSDKAKRVYLYDNEAGRVLHCARTVIDPSKLRRSRHTRIVDLEKKLRCTKCGARDGNTLKTGRVKRD